MTEKQFWTLDKSGKQILKNLAQENKSFTKEKFLIGEFDGVNFQYKEMFDTYIYDANGCDYERYGCEIKPGDVVLDIGANVGVFAHRAHTRGAKKIYSFEPLSPTFSCLDKNKDPNTQTFKMGVGTRNEFREFKIHTDFTHIGGGTCQNNDFIDNKNIIYQEKVMMVDINQVFEQLCDQKIDFLKIDTEGSEVEILNHITDENLKSLRCLAGEFHAFTPEFDLFQEYFIKRMQRLGFSQFVLYYGDMKLRTINFWKV